MQHIIIRSSAVFSEDNDQTTGAGIYHSEPLLGKYTFKDFCTAIEKVYISCDSENALLYRQKNNIGDEKMGISIQKYIHSTLCQVNSIMV